MRTNQALMIGSFVRALELYRIDAIEGTERAIGLKHGMHFHDQEFWHIEFTVSGLHRGRAVDVVGN